MDAACAVFDAAKSRSKARISRMDNSIRRVSPACGPREYRIPGEGDDYLYAALKDGAIDVRVKLRSGFFDAEIKPKTDTVTSSSLIQSSAAGVFVSGGLGATRFDDDRWHKLAITRDVRELVANRGICHVTVQVDDDLQKTGTTVGDFTTLSSRVVYVGGMPNPATHLSPSVTSSAPLLADNFRGCLKQVVYRADGVNLDVISLGQRRVFFESRGTATFGSCAADATTPILPVTFTYEHSVIALPTWLPTASASRSLRFQMTTVEPTALILYSFGPSGTSDFFGAELVDGFLFFVLDLGAGSLKIKASNSRVDDGRAHQVSLAIDGVYCSVAVDGRDRRYVISGPGGRDQLQSVRGSASLATVERLDLAGSLYLGGLGHSSPSTFGSPSDRLATFPAEMWTPVWRRGYVGCIRDLAVNGDRVDVAGLGRDQEVIGLVDHCRRGDVGISVGAVASSCASSPCLHNGRCQEGWNRFVCDCSGTGYRGTSCRLPARTLSLNGSQFVAITLKEDGAGAPEVSDISVRFRTRYASGQLLATSSIYSSDQLSVVLINGRVRTEISMALDAKILTSGQSLNDDRWHTVYIKRRAHLVELSVDNATKTKVEMNGRSRVFSITSMVVGSSMTGNGSALRSADTEQRGWRKKRALRRPQSVSRRLHRDVIGDKSVTSGRDFAPSTGNASVVRPFVGKIQQLTVNGRELLELVRTGTTRDGDQLGGKTRTTGVLTQRSNDEITATFVGGQFDPPTGSIRPETAVTFRSSDAYTIVRMRIHLKFTIFFKLKTAQRNGLVLYIGGERDFLAVELVDGQVRYLYDVGGGPRMVRVQVRHTISDNRWHDIAIQRNELTKHELRVDDATSTDITRDPSELGPDSKFLPGQSSAVFQSTSSAVHFDVGDRLFIGGAPRSVFAGEAAGSRHIRSRAGFQGCLANVDLGGDIRPLVDQGAKPPDEYADQVAPGCEGPSERCTADACDNAGRCIQEWETRTCDCDLTSFTGPTCDEDGIAYRFGGQQAGLITVTFPQNERVDSFHDQVAFGFSTTQRDGVFVHVTSGNSNDFISVELVDGNVVAMYNMGISDHVVRLQAKRFNDGHYHIVRFLRNGANSSLQVDDLPATNTQPTGRQHTLFNSQAHIFVGGRRDTIGNVLRPFRGTVAGLVFNGQKVFEMAADDDLRVAFDGDVERDTRPLRSDVRKRTTPKPLMTAVRQTDAKQTTAIPSIHDKMQSNAAADGSSPTSSCQGKQDGGAVSSGCIPSNFTDAFLSGPSNVQASSGPSKDPDRTTRRIGDRERLPVPLPSSFTSAGGAVTFSTAPSATNRLNSSSGFVNKSPGLVKPTGGTSAESLIESSSQRLAKTSPSAAASSTRTSSGRSSSTTPKVPNSGRQATSGGAHGSLATSVALIGGCVTAIVVLLLALAFGVYKYRSRDEGVYRIDDVKNYFAPTGGVANGVTLAGGGAGSNGGYETCGMNPLTPGGEGRTVAGTSGSKKVSKSRSKKASGRSSRLLQQQGSVREKNKENREWYV